MDMQIVKYKWETNQINGEPFLFARDGDNISKLRLFDENLNLSIGKKYCIGFTKNGKHVDCQQKRAVEKERVCRECALNDDFFMCMKCNGSECINEPQRPSCMENSYFIYLAAFNSMLKVGISYQFRVLERLIEQGADMGAKIGFVKDGKVARQLEQEIGKELNIIDRVSGLDKHRMLFGNINVASINIFNAVTKLRSTVFGDCLIKPEIYNLQSIYRLGAVTKMPTPMDISEGLKISGTVIAAKGNILVLENVHGMFTVNANKLLGCDIALN